jgi:hypothetical protein
VTIHRPSNHTWSSVGHTSSRRVPGHSVVCRDYPSRDRNGYTSSTPRDRVPRHVAWLVVDYFAYAARPGASARRAARHRLLRLHSTSGFLSTSRGSSRGSSSITSTMSRVRAPRHVAQLVAPLVINFDYAACLGASARHAARRAARRRLLRPTMRPGASTRRAPRRRLLRQHSASG